ncbi:MAG: SDR family oxidoreductase [Hydrogenophaga sp.]|jgi:NAD(P)-dependent dehydrogenase (short-subunit alcohol dehydrogenase family)|nr:SDR family oxidoreductase [Hydrogenophaga sp.]
MTTVTVQDLLRDRIAVITGGGGGIGAGLALGLAAHGAIVVVTGRTESSLAHTVAAVRAAGGRAHAVAMDVTDAASCAAAAERIAAEIGEVSILVNNAGVIEYVPMEDEAVGDAWKHTIETNLNGPFNTAKAFLAPLKATRGAIVNIGSIAATVYTGNTVGYSASKGGVHMLTVALARELGKDGVRVNTVAPGAIATPMSPSAGDETRMANLMRRVPLGRIGQPEDLVGPVVFLASPLAAYVTGATLRADGGYLTN